MHKPLLVTRLAAVGALASALALLALTRSSTMLSDRGRLLTGSPTVDRDRKAGSAEPREKNANPPGATRAPAGPARGMWISGAELARKPMTGRAWENLLSIADADLGPLDVTDMHSTHDIRTLAVALVYARTGEPAYRWKALGAIMANVDADGCGDQVHPWARNLVSYIIAADLIELESFDPASDARFREWLERLRRLEFADGTLINNDERHANNHGRYAGATRVAIASYLGDHADLERAARVFRGFLGDRDSYSGFRYRDDMSWQADQRAPVGINPLGAEIDGFPVDGILPEEMRRGCSFRVPPRWTDYLWEGLQGVVVEAVLLSRQGYHAFNWEDRAILRAVERIDHLARASPCDPWWTDGEESFVIWIVNSVYGTDFPALPLESRAAFGDNCGFTDWTHGPDAPE